MIRVKDKGDLYVHQAEGDQGGSLKNWNVIGTILDTTFSAARSRRLAASGRSPATTSQGHLVEREVYSPYGELTVHQSTGFGDRDGDGDVDSTDKVTVGTTCTGTVSGSCRILDLDFDGDYDSTDAGFFDSLPQGLQRTPGKLASAVQQPFAHQGLLFEPEIGSYQNRARQYDPAKRRFDQRDPLLIMRVTRSGYEGRSAYQVNNHNPVRFIDPSGLSQNDFYCCITNCTCCATALTAGASALTTLSNQGVPSSSPAHDPMRHCLSSCYTQKAMPIDVCDFWDCREQPGTTNSEQADLHNNQQGRLNSASGAGCWGSCKSDYNNGVLRCPNNSSTPCGGGGPLP